MQQILLKKALSETAECEIDTNTTQYWTRESFSGIFAPVLKILLARDLQHGFDAVAQNLKARIESNHHKHEKPL